MTRKIHIALAVALTSAAACTLEPSYQRPDTAAPALTPVQGIMAADIGWHEFFLDPQLQQLITLALQNNRDLRIAALNVESAQAQYRIQRADLFPSIAANGTETVQRAPAPPATSNSVSRLYDVGIGFTSYEIDFFGRIRSLNHAALQQYFSARETQRSAQLTLVAQVATAYLALLADQTLLDITQDTLKTQSDSYDLTNKLFTAGVTTQLALSQAEITVDTARANLAQYTRQLAQDRNALQLLIGTTIPETLDLSGGLDRSDPIAELEEGISSDVLVQRPDILASEHQLQAANADIGAARAAFFPSLQLTANYGTASTQLSGLFKSGSQAWNFQPSINLPIFNAGANIAGLKAVKVAQEIAVAQYQKAIQSAFREVADGLAARGTLNDQLTAQQALLVASKEAFRLADMRFHGGVDSYLNVLDAQRTLYSAQQQLAGVRLSRLENLVTLYKALGGGLAEHSVAPPAQTKSPT